MKNCTQGIISISVPFLFVYVPFFFVLFSGIWFKLFC